MLPVFFTTNGDENLRTKKDPEDYEPEFLWERQNGESEQAYEAFQIYRNMGSSRTCTEVARKTGKTKQLMSKWKKMHEWSARCVAYDNYLERRVHEESIKELKEMYKRHTVMAGEMQELAAEALKNIKVEELGVKEVREYIKAAIDIERASRSSMSAITGKNEEEVNQLRVEVGSVDSDKEVAVTIYMPQKEAEEDV